MDDPLILSFSLDLCCFFCVVVVVVVFLLFFQSVVCVVFLFSLNLFLCPGLFDFFHRIKILILTKTLCIFRGESRRKCFSSGFFSFINCTLCTYKHFARIERNRNLKKIISFSWFTDSAEAFSDGSTFPVSVNVSHFLPFF